MRKFCRPSDRTSGSATGRYVLVSSLRVRSSFWRICESAKFWNSGDINLTIWRLMRFWKVWKILRKYSARNGDFHYKAGRQKIRIFGKRNPILLLCPPPPAVTKSQLQMGRLCMSHSTHRFIKGNCTHVTWTKWLGYWFHTSNANRMFTGSHLWHIQVYTTLPQDTSITFLPQSRKCHSW